MVDPIRKRKPIAGALWGVLLGLGLALLAINSKVISLAIAPIALVVAVGIVIGVVWSTLGPAKKAKGAPPAGDEHLPPAAPPAVDGEGETEGETEGEADTEAETESAAEAEATAPPDDEAPGARTV